MKLLLIILILCLPLSATVAQSITDTISDQDQNKRWLSSLQEADLEKKIQIISKRILSDTATYEAMSKVQPILRPTPESTRSGIICFANTYPCCLPLMLFHGKRSYTSKNIDAQALKNLSSILSPATVKNINIYVGAAASALYGIEGSNGVLVFELRNKRAEKKIKELIRTDS